VAFLFFRLRRCDSVVLEVGMGGRLDSTNVIGAPEAAVICNIGLDHTKELGDTVEKIAFEKAGIIKAGCPVVLYEPEKDSARAVVEQVCRERGARLTVADFSKLHPLSFSVSGQTFSYGDYDDLQIRLLGAHQLKNAAVVVETVRVLRAGGWNIPDAALRQGLGEAVWPGRFEVLCREPVFIADGGHNRQCVAAVAEALRTYFPGRPVHFILGVLADKDYLSMLELLAPLAEGFYTVTPNSPRALPAAKLARELAPYGKPVQVCQSAAEAVEKAFAGAAADTVLCSVGSLYMTGEIRTAVQHRLNSKN
jgi:dihydrofolate synthase/folylpolyglutamate synthase